MAFSPKLDSSADQRLRELLAHGDRNQRALILPLMGDSWGRRQPAPIINSPLVRPQSKPLGAVAGLATAALSEAKPQAPLPGPALPAAGQESGRLPGAGSSPTGWTLPAAGAPAAARAKDDAGGAPPLTTTPAVTASDWVVPLGFADAAPPAPAVPSPSDGPGPDPRPRILVRWSSDATDQDRSEALARVGGIRLDLIHTALMKAQGDGALEVIQADEATSLEAMLQAYGQTAKVLYAEVDQSLRSQVVSNDASYLSGSLWGMYGSDALIPIGPTGTTNVFGSQAETAWDRGFTGDKSVFVGIIDTGIDVSHPDLKDNIWTNPFDPVDGIDNDRNGYIDDSRGWDFFNNDNSVYDGSSDSHGTHVAGTIGATGRNAIGVAGVSWNVSMISAKFLGSSGGYVSGAIKALDYLTDLKLRHNLNIIATNNSWGGGAYSQALHEAIIRAARQNILFIAAAGNSARNNDLTPAFPANYSTLVGTPSLAAASQETVISVAAITNTGSLSSFSNYGLTTVDLGAPGSGILSTVPGGGYASYNGTSMATPHVSGAAALYAASNPGASAGQIRTALLASTTPTPSLAGRTVTGGRLNVASLLESGASTWISIYASQSALPEGQSGSTSFQFQVGRAGNTSTTHTVSWKLAGTGPAPATEADFAGQSTLTGVLTFDPGQTLKTLNIDVAGDTEVEFAEAFTVTIFDASGGAVISTARASSSISNDDLPTTTAVITSITDDVGLLQGLVSPGASTNDPTPSLSGSLSAALASGESLLIYNGSSLLGAANVSGLSWAFTPSLPATGGTSYSFTARVASAFGPLGPLSPARSLVLDTSAPSITASIDAVADNVGVIQGPVAAGASSNDSTPTLSGSLAAALVGGDTLRVFNGSVLLGTASVNNTTRSWSYTPSPGLPAGSHNFSVAVADAAGNLAPTSNTWAYSLDTSAPSLTISSGASVLKAGDTTTITFSFSEDPGTSFSRNGVAGDVTLTGGSLSAIAGSGLTRTATFTPTANSVGTATVKVASGTYNDPAGNPGGAASSAPLAYDTLPPSIGAAITSVSDDIGLWQGLVAEGGSSDDATPTLAGTLTAALASGDSLRVFNGAASVGAASVNNSAKTWTFTPSTGLADGTYAFRVAVADAFGNLGPLSTVRSLTVDTLAPSLAISSDKTALQAGATALISFTFSEDPGESFAWDGSQGDLIISGGTLSALSSSNGLIRSATFTPTANSQGTAVIAVLAGSYYDASGNLGAAASLANLTFDTLLPSAGALLS